MLNKRTSRAFRWGVLSLLVAAAVLRLAVAWQPVEVLLTKNLPDDAYYYFVLAHNAIQHGSVSMDGIHPTNGFHPLWMVLLTPIFGASADPGNLSVHLALSLGALLDLITIGIVAYLALQLTPREGPALLAAGLYAFNPIVILQTTNGLETSLAVLSVALLLLVAVRWHQDPSWRVGPVWLGIAAGAAFLARTDNVFVVGLTFLALLWFRRGEWSKIRRVVLAGVVSLLTTAPWFLWSRLAVGSWFQDSGSAVPYAARARFVIEHGSDLGPMLAESMRQVVYPANLLRGDFSGLPLFVGFLFWLIVAIGLIRRWRKISPEPERLILLPLLGAGLLLVVAHAAARWYPRPWYFVSTSLAFALAFAVAFQSFLRNLPRRLFFVSLGFAVYFALGGYIFWAIGYYPWQTDMLAGSRWMATNLPEEAKVGSFNSGIYSYYNEFTVVNLDGVVNHEAYEAIQQRRILPYLQRSSIDYLIDSDNAFFREYAPFMGPGFPEDLVEVETLSDDELGGFGMLRIYRIEGH